MRGHLILLAGLIAACSCASADQDAASADTDRKLRELRQRQDRLERQIADLDVRVALMAEKVDRSLPRHAPELEVVRLPPPQSPPEEEAEIDEIEPPAASDPEPPAIVLTLPSEPDRPPKKGDVKAVYGRARSFYTEGRYEAALHLFAELSTRYPSHALADNSVYWQGVCLLEMGRHAQAIDQLQKVSVLYPRSPKVPDALLKTGEAYRALGDQVSARVFLSQVIEQYPRSEAAQVAKSLLKPAAEGE